jgi:hypothetical protein
MHQIDRKPRPVSLLKGLSTKQVLKIATGKEPDLSPKCRQGKLIAKTVLDPV